MHEDDVKMILCLIVLAILLALIFGGAVGQLLQQGLPGWCQSQLCR